MNMEIVLLVDRVLGTVTKMLAKWLEELNIRGKIARVAFHRSN